jgi:hypothetical protein
MYPGWVVHEPPLRWVGVVGVYRDASKNRPNGQRLPRPTATLSKGTSAAT